jgi:hypothetical protein
VAELRDREDYVEYIDWELSEAETAGPSGATTSTRWC